MAGERSRGYGWSERIGSWCRDQAFLVRRRQRGVALRRCAAVAAAGGGAAWTVKATVTLVTGDEPAAVFAIGFALFPFALLGLWSLVHEAEGRASAVGGIFAAAAAVSVLLVVLVRVIGGAAVEPSDAEVPVLTPFIVVGGFGRSQPCLRSASLRVAPARWRRPTHRCRGQWVWE